MLHENKGINVIVNNAGYALVGALEDLTMEEKKAQFETNLFGAIRGGITHNERSEKRNHCEYIFYGTHVAIPLDSA